MPNDSTATALNRQHTRLSKSLIAFIGAIAVGVVLVILFNNNGMPFGRSLNRHPVQLIGLILIVLATFGLVVLCVRCLVLSSSPTSLVLTPGPTTLRDGTTSFTFTTNGRPPNAMLSTWQVIHPSQSRAPPTHTGYIYPNTGTYRPYDSGQGYTQQSEVPQTPPPEFELPPSYAEATKGLHTDVIK